MAVLAWSAKEVRIVIAVQGLLNWFVVMALQGLLFK